MYFLKLYFCPKTELPQKISNRPKNRQPRQSKISADLWLIGALKRQLTTRLMCKAVSVYLIRREAFSLYIIHNHHWHGCQTDWNSKYSMAVYGPGTRLSSDIDKWIIVVQGPRARWHVAWFKLWRSFGLNLLVLGGGQWGNDRLGSLPCVNLSLREEVQNKVAIIKMPQWCVAFLCERNKKRKK